MIADGSDDIFEFRSVLSQGQSFSLFIPERI
jgi:hypothetical protein